MLFLPEFAATALISFPSVGGVTKVVVALSRIGFGRGTGRQRFVGRGGPRRS